MELSPPAKRLAAIDVGSNSIRLLVAEASADGRYRILDDEKRTTRLARGLAQMGRLSEEAIQESIEALGRMKAIAEGYDVRRLRVIATSAVREAANRKRFLDLARDRLDLNVEVIAPEDEARLSLLSAARHFDLRNQDAAIVDLGGGSAEIVFAAKGVIEEIHSLPLGAVRLTESHIHSDPIDRREFRRLQKHIRKTLRRALGKLRFRPHVIIGAGGTFTALANISMRRRGEHHPRVGGYELVRSEVRHIRDRLADLPVRERRQVPGLNADRADIIVAGVTLVERLMKLLRVNRLQVHDQGVRDGVMLRMIVRAFAGKGAGGGRSEEEGDPLAGVREFAAACGITHRHSGHVCELARQLFDQLQVPLKLDPAERVLLESAALLHEVGYLINYAKHHQHTYHLVMHGNLRGLSPRQRELVANVARYHRRAPPKMKHENFARLAPDDRAIVRRLSAILRLADGLDRDHTQQINSVECRWDRRRLAIVVHADQRPDVNLWGAQQKGKLFRQVFRVKLKCLWRPLRPGSSGNGRRSDSPAHAPRTSLGVELNGKRPGTAASSDRRAKSRRGNG